jgi:hypothetical protein
MPDGPLSQTSTQIQPSPTNSLARKEKSHKVRLASPAAQKSTRKTNVICLSVEEQNKVADAFRESGRRLEEGITEIISKCA